MGGKETEGGAVREPSGEGVDAPRVGEAACEDAGEDEKSGEDVSPPPPVAVAEGSAGVAEGAEADGEGLPLASDGDGPPLALGGTEAVAEAVEERDKEAADDGVGSATVGVSGAVSVPPPPSGA